MAWLDEWPINSQNLLVVSGTWWFWVQIFGCGDPNRLVSCARTPFCILNCCKVTKYPASQPADLWWIWLVDHLFNWLTNTTPVIEVWRAYYYYHYVFIVKLLKCGWQVLHSTGLKHNCGQNNKTTGWTTDVKNESEMQTVTWGKHQKSVLHHIHFTSLRLDAEVHLNVSWTGFKGEVVRHCSPAVAWALPRWPEKIHSLFPVSTPLTLSLQGRHSKSVRICYQLMTTSILTIHSDATWLWYLLTDWSNQSCADSDIIG